MQPIGVPCTNLPPRQPSVSQLGQARPTGAPDIEKQRQHLTKPGIPKK
jgi:hypothetical protein